MPPVECGYYLIEFLYEIGPVMGGGMGGATITWGEIESWCNRTGVQLEPWEARTIRRLSVEYIAESHRATTAYIPPPWAPPDAPPPLHPQQARLRQLAEESNK